MELRTPARSDIPVLLGLPQLPNCSDAADQDFANDMQLSAVVTDLRELNAACMAFAGWQD